MDFQWLWEIKFDIENENLQELTVAFSFNFLSWNKEDLYQHEDLISESAIIQLFVTDL